MSLGYEGVCKLFEQDSELAIYVYSGADWDNPNHKGHSYDYDGIILVYKHCLEKPEIHTKIKKRASGRKYISCKIITHIPNITEHIKNGDVVIERECRNAFFRHRDDSIDYIAYKLLVKLFEFYQKNGYLPEKEGFVK